MKSLESTSASPFVKQSPGIHWLRLYFLKLHIYVFICFTLCFWNPRPRLLYVRSILLLSGSSNSSRPCSDDLSNENISLWNIISPPPRQHDSKGLITWAGLVWVCRDLGLFVKSNKNQLRDYMTTVPAHTEAARLTRPALTEAARLTRPALTEAARLTVPALTEAARLTRPALTEAARLTVPALTEAARLTRPALTEAARLTGPALTEAARLTRPALTEAARLTGPAWLV